VGSRAGKFVARGSDEADGDQECVASRAASRAFRFVIDFFAAEEMMTESLVARVMTWMAEKRTAVNNDPRIVPRILGVAEPITVPTW
jgi:hypothetical protein